MNFLKRLLVESVNVLFALVVALLLFVAIRTYVVQPFQVDGHSMDLTLADGEHLFLLKQSQIERFDVIVFPDPAGSGNSYVKRLIGLPGDQLYVQDDVLYLNNVPIEEPYLEPLKSNSAQPFTAAFSLYDTLGIDTIPEGYYFVMGDNRPESGDSRQFGLVPIDSVQGEANLVYFPFHRFRLLTDYTQ
ncbi:MAG: signal peptidase I [Aerococcaceae bacterium]|nr:signal peptidase I [Aerococcaceae bacterium]